MSLTAHLEEGVLLFTLELVGAKEVETTLGFFRVETLFRALEKFEHIVDNDGLKIDLLLVVEVFSRELNLGRDSEEN